MAYVTVDVDVDIDEFSDKEIMDEYNRRNLGEVQPNDLNVYASAVGALRRGDKQEGFILLERCLPELKGLLIN